MIKLILIEMIGHSHNENNLFLPYDLLEMQWSRMHLISYDINDRIIT